MEKKNKKHSKILKRFVLSYSVIIILPLLVGLISYKESARIISNDTQNTQIAILRQSMTILDRIATEIDRVTWQIAANPQVVKFGYTPDFSDNSEFYYRTWETLSYIEPYSAYENTGIKYNIYFHKTDTVLNQNGAYTLPEYYKYFGYTDMSIEDFRQQYLNKFNKGSFVPSQTVKWTEITQTSNRISQYSVITYFKSMPLMNSGILNAMIFASIRETEVQKLLNGLDISEDGCVYILDENSNVITGIPDHTGKISPYDIEFKDQEGFIEKNINGNTMYITYTVSSCNGWKYISAVPANIVMAKVNSIRNFILGVTIISLSIGIVLLILLSYANSRPIIELKRTLLDFFESEANNKKDEFDFLKSSISDLIRQSSVMKSDMQNQRLTLQKSVIEHLLVNRNISPNIMKWASQAGVDLNAQAYACVLIKMSNEQLASNPLQEYNMGQIIHTETGHRGYLIDINSTTFCLLLCFSTREEKECRQHTESVLSWLGDQIYRSTNITPTFTIGSTYNELGGIYHSYNEAKQACDFMPIREPSTILWYSDLEIDSKGSYYYPIEVEQRLIHLVKHGYKTEVSNLLSTILQMNLENTAFLHKTQLLLCNELYGTIHKLNMDNKEDVIAKLDNCKSLNEIFKYLQSVLNAYCDTLNEQKNNRSLKLVEEIITYLHANYSDSNLCLSQVASKFDLSEGYISQLFKEHTGEYFAAYLENIRLNHACKLLSENSCTINEVAFNLGYNSPQSFRRAFKRVKGFNPSDLKV